MAYSAVDAAYPLTPKRIWGGRQVGTGREVCLSPNSYWRRNLLSCVVPARVGFIDLVTRTRYSDANTGLVASTGQRGPMMGGADGSATKYSAINALLTGAFTLAVHGRYATSVGSFMRIFGLLKYTDEATNGGLAINTDASNNLSTIICRNNNAGGYRCATSTGLTLNTENSIVMTGSGSATPVLYLNGTALSFGTTGTNQAALFNGDETLQLGGPNFSCFVASIWNRQFTASEALTLSRHPFSMLTGIDDLRTFLSISTVTDQNFYSWQTR